MAIATLQNPGGTDFYHLQPNMNIVIHYCGVKKGLEADINDVIPATKASLHR